MSRLVITGFSGFVARHFVEYLYNNKLEYEVLGLDINEPAFSLSDFSDILTMSFKKANLLDKEAVRDCIKEFKPDYILHLASFSSVGYSWEHPADCFSNNTNIFLNVTEAVREFVPQCRILSVGSSEEYGNVTEDKLPLKEDLHLVPVNPYAVARISQEMMGKVFADSFGMNIVFTRSFNHMGPYQDQRFVIPSFVKRVLDVANSGKAEGEIETGDITIVRDFVDVRDVVRAYYLLLTEGNSGEIYNICRGEGTTLLAIVDEIADILGVKITCKVNPDFVRPDDNRVVIGSYEKIKRDLGWEPEISTRETLKSMIEYMKA